MLISIKFMHIISILHGYIFRNINFSHIMN